MRSEKGITLVALIGIFVLIVILAGISISIAAKGNNEEPVAPVNDVSTEQQVEEDEEELVVDPTAGSNTNDSEVEVPEADDTTAPDETVENVVDEENTTVEDANTVANEV